MFLGIIESKMKVIDAFLINKLWAGSHIKFYFVPSKGRFGGLCFQWNFDIVSNYVMDKVSCWISFPFDWDGYQVRITLIYVPNLAADRDILWDEIRPLFNFNGVVFLMGGFNEIVSPYERKGCTNIAPSVMRYCSFFGLERAY